MILAKTISLAVILTWSTKGLEMFRLTDNDKRVIFHFINAKPCEGKRLSTDGGTLDGCWMGGKALAVWETGKIHTTEGTKSRDTIRRFINKNT